MIRECFFSICLIHERFFSIFFIRERFFSICPIHERFPEISYLMLEEPSSVQGLSMIHEAMFYEKLRENKVRCSLCAHRCKIAPGKRGICRVRENCEGSLFSLVYGTVSSEGVEHIEKKPLFHFYPG